MDKSVKKRTRKEEIKHTFKFLGSDCSFDNSVVEPPLLAGPFDLNSLALDVSGSCNMQCVYCAESSTMPQRRAMSEETLKKALDRLVAWAPAKNLSIHVGSGEPFLQPLAVREIGRTARNLAAAHHLQVSLHITTNGTLLTEEICTWLLEEGWRVKVSLDGTASIHDENRKDRQGRGTYHTIETYVRMLARKRPEQFSTTSVLCHGTDPAEVFYGIARLGVKTIEIVPVAALIPSPLVLTEEDTTLYRRFLSDYVEKIARGVRMPLLTRFIKRLHEVMGYNNSRVACGAGRTFLAVGPDELLYPCFRFVGIKEYELGNLDTGIDPDSAEQFWLKGGRPYDERELCRKCWAAPLCGGPCFACAELLFCKNGEPSPDYCLMVKADCEAALWLAQTLRERNPERLVEFLGVHLEE